MAITQKILQTEICSKNVLIGFYFTPIYSILILLFKSMKYLKHDKVRLWKSEVKQDFIIIAIYSLFMHNLLN